MYRVVIIAYERKFVNGFYEKIKKRNALILIVKSESVQKSRYKAVYTYLITANFYYEFLICEFIAI